MRRWVTMTALAIALLIAAPPLWFAVMPAEGVSLPPPGRKVPVAAGVGVNVLESGAGPPIVLIHGLPGTAYSWAPVAEGLSARGHRVLAYDRVGYAHSDARADGDYSVDANARELLALLEAEDLRDATIVGWSFGGKTAMTAALADDARIGRLVLVASAGDWSDPPPPSPLLSILFSAPVSEWMAAVPPFYREIQRGMGLQFFSEQPIPDWFRPASAANFASARTRHTWRQEAARFRFDGPDPSPIERPILVIHGDDDRVIPLEVAEGIHDRAPDSELVVVSGGSHAIPVTHVDLVVEHTAAFAAARRISGQDRAWPGPAGR